MGSDRWGDYYSMTGFEASGFCFWCGKPVKNKRYCSKECQDNYDNHFRWNYARDWCIQRAGNKCEKCGASPKVWNGDKGEYIYEPKNELEAHHIDPLGDEQRHINKKNRPENLQCLCLKCHGETRRKPINPTEKPFINDQNDQLRLF